MEKKIDITFLLIKTISMALILTIPLSLISFPEIPPLRISFIEENKVIGLLLLSFAWGLMIYLKYFEVNKRKDERELTTRFLIDLFVTFIVSLFTLFLLYIGGVLFVVLFYVLFCQIFLIIKFGFKKWLNI